MHKKICWQLCIHRKFNEKYVGQEKERKNEILTKRSSIVFGCHIRVSSLLLLLHISSIQLPSMYLFCIYRSPPRGSSLGADIVYTNKATHTHSHFDYFSPFLLKSRKNTACLWKWDGNNVKNMKRLMLGNFWVNIVFSPQDIRENKSLSREKQTRVHSIGLNIQNVFYKQISF